MQLQIVSNSAQPAWLRSSYVTAIAQAIGDRPGQWCVWLSQFKPGLPLTVMIQGPKGLRACQVFEEADELTPEVVLSRIKVLLASRHRDRTI